MDNGNKVPSIKVKCFCPICETYWEFIIPDIESYTHCPICNHHLSFIEKKEVE